MLAGLNENWSVERKPHDQAFTSSCHSLTVLKTNCSTCVHSIKRLLMGVAQKYTSDCLVS